MREDEPHIVEIVIRHELAIKELYKIFATKFTNRQDLWRSLAADEHRHADWLRTLRSEPTITKLLHDSQLKPQAIKTSTAYVESQLMKAKEGHLSLLQALSIARDIENAALEMLFPS